MKNVRRLAQYGAALLAAAGSLFGVQSARMARARASEAVRAEIGPKAPAVPATQAPAPRVFENARMVGGRLNSYAGAVWVGYMRAGSGYSPSPKWQVGRRGRSRMGGRS